VKGGGFVKAARTPALGLIATYKGQWAEQGMTIWSINGRLFYRRNSDMLIFEREKIVGRDTAAVKNLSEEDAVKDEKIIAAVNNGFRNFFDKKIEKWA